MMCSRTVGKIKNSFTTTLSLLIFLQLFADKILRIFSCCLHFHVFSPYFRFLRFLCFHVFPPRCSSGVGAPVIGDLDGEYKHDSRRNLLEWSLPVIDINNKTGSLEFSVAGQPNDFFPINVSFVSKRNYCDIQVGGACRFSWTNKRREGF